jgi:hypothetical protein
VDVDGLDMSEGEWIRRGGEKKKRGGKRK